uniref:Uncharacterized protein n=1 Tax=Arundo donax TaxID=35708 RepID=A0A0A8Y7J2_ARUDO
MARSSRRRFPSRACFLLGWWILFNFFCGFGVRNFDLLGVLKDLCGYWLLVSICCHFLLPLRVESRNLIWYYILVLS